MCRDVERTVPAMGVDTQSNFQSVLCCPRALAGRVAKSDQAPVAHPPRQFATACCARQYPVRLPVAPRKLRANAPTLLVGDGTCRAPWPRRYSVAGLRGLRLPLCAGAVPCGWWFALCDKGGATRSRGIDCVCDARATAGSSQRSGLKHLERRQQQLSRWWW